MLDVEIKKNIEPEDFIKCLISIVKDGLRMKTNDYITQRGLFTILNRIITEGEEYLKIRRE